MFPRRLSLCERKSFHRAKGDAAGTCVTLQPEQLGNLVLSFAKNRWFAEDTPDRSTPKLPTEEQDDTYGSDLRVKKRSGNENSHV